MRALDGFGLNTGTSGNISTKSGSDILITPSGISPAGLTPDKIVRLSSCGDHEDQLKPSSEWRIHIDIYSQFLETRSVVHVHSPYATAIACQGLEIPAFHYMVAAVGGENIRCAPYATFGTQELSNLCLSALDGRLACLMENHGMVALGETLDLAINIAVLVEELCKQFLLSSMIGPPNLISSVEMKKVLEKFKNYGA